MESKQINLMGTTITLTVDADNGAEIIDQTFEKLQIFEKRFSANDPSSELGYLNNHAYLDYVQVHPQLFDLIAMGVEHSQAPQSNLNIAIGPLVQLWRIGFADARQPEQYEIEQVLPLINPFNIHLDHENHAVKFDYEGMKIDLGALAKGYAADLTKKFLQEQGVKAGLVNLGGNVLTFGNHPENPDGKWTLGIQHPDHEHGQYFKILKLKNKSVVTSGTYIRRFTKNQQEFHHLFDSTTGYPIESEISSLTIISDLSVDGEIWTSRLFGHTSQEMYQEIKQHPDLDLIAFTKDNYYWNTIGVDQLTT